MQISRSLKQLFIAIAVLGIAVNTDLVAAELQTANAIGSLQIQDHEWDNVRRQLKVAKQMGVDAISTDVWWGKVEGAGDQQFNWGFYDRLVAEIEAAGLHWVPIMSFHKCGTNVGDECFEPIPNWIWKHFAGAPPKDLQYMSELGHQSEEVVALWADHLVIPEYKEFMEAFETHYAGKADIIDEINISTGTAGELRYPSYNAHDNYGYPHRGFFQAYGNLAVQSLRDFALGKYGDLAGVNNAWGTALTSAEQIRPPSDANTFVNRKDYVKTQYGRDFIDWYNQSLIEHGIRMVNVADNAFDGAFKDIELGVKIPGIHWRINDPQTPRIAEITTGLIRTSIDFHSDATAHGYAPLIGVWSHFNSHPRDVVLHFTALELANNRDASMGAHSAAEDLVGWVAAGAAAQAVEIKGENALQPEIKHHRGWDKIEKAFRDHAYVGFSALRLAEISDNSVAHERYGRMIANRPVGPCGFQSMNLRGTHNNWGVTPMSCDAAAGAWEVQVTFPGGADQVFKFDVHGDWRDNYGDNEPDGVGELFGADIAVTDGAGRYRIAFNGQGRAYTVTQVEDGSSCRFPSLNVRGTHNDWGVTPMTCSSGNWQASIVFRGAPEERFKFDVHGDWRDNYGDNQPDGIGDSFGADIMIIEGSGAYRITFDDSSKAYTVTKQ